MATPVQLGDQAVELPRLELRGLARRAAVPAALVAVLGGTLLLGGGPARAFADALARATEADPRWIAAAAAFEILSFTGYIVLLWLVGGRATQRIDLRASAQITLGGAAATRLLPTAGVGGAVLTLWALRRSGLPSRVATRTLLTFLVLLYAVFLGTLLVAGGALALGLAHSDGPRALAAVPAAAAATAILAALAMAALTRGAGADARAARGLLPRARARGHEIAFALGAGVRGALQVLRTGDPRLLGALAWWTFDAAVLWAMLQAFGAPPGLAVLALAYVLGQVGNTLPIPGAVSGGIAGALIAFGTPAEIALVSVLAYRAIAIWLPAPVGLAALGSLRRTLTAWGRQAAPVAAPEVTGQVHARRPPRAHRPACEGAVATTCRGALAA
ncbi:MAG: hypothetical protein QOH43_703 [Solirubrobacteraceae bacterium]|nr:hypothetical protein [Solirubrobacteraceae bacterium]